jgi:ribosomal-protein-alanine N-acetyltransferase
MNKQEVFRHLPVLITERLKLRPLTMDDVDDVFAYTSDPEVARFIRRPLHETRADAEAYVRAFVEAHGRGEASPWGVEHVQDGKIIGTCGFYYLNEHDARAEVYYALSRAYWKHGYMTEAVRAVLKYGFNEIGLNRIDGACWAENTDSAHVLEKVGMQYEGVWRQFIFVKGAFRDIRWYSILRQEYPARANG